jgi:hypothetical protein
MLFDAAGFVDAVTSVGHRIDDMHKQLPRKTLAPRHVVCGEKPRKERE